MVKDFIEISVLILGFGFILIMSIRTTVKIIKSSDNKNIFTILIAIIYGVGAFCILTGIFAFILLMFNR